RGGGMNVGPADGVQERADALRLARRAADLGKEDAFALAWAGYVFALVSRDVEQGAALADRAIELNPNLALAWGISGWMGLVLGQPEIAIERTARAMRLSPLDPFMRGWQSSLAIGHFLAGRYDEASSWAARAMQPDPDFANPLRIAAASYALAGRVDEAKTACARLRELEPQLRVSNFRDLMLPLRPADFARWEEGLRIAGLPD